MIISWNKKLSQNNELSQQNIAILTRNSKILSPNNKLSQYNKIISISKQQIKLDKRYEVRIVIVIQNNSLF